MKTYIIQEILKREEYQKKRWIEHFQGLLNRPMPEEPLDLPAAATDLGMNIDRPSMADIVMAIISLRSEKLLGPCGMPPEQIQSDTQTSADIFCCLLGKIWDDEELQKDQKEGYNIVKLPKTIIFMNARTTEVPLIE